MESEKYVVLFDIDGTLIDSNGAGGLAMLQAAAELFDRPTARQVALHGRTDRGIMHELLSVNGVEPSESNLHALARHYFSLLPNELKNRCGRVLPGVLELLIELVDDNRCHLGLLTGNLAQAARLKLEHFKLWGFFNYGVFGHVALERRGLRDAALNFARELAGEIPNEHVIVIGDTVLDVDLALAMQARCLGVCTGGGQAEELRAAGAHHVVTDLSQTNAMVRWIFE